MTAVSNLKNKPELRFCTSMSTCVLNTCGSAVFAVGEVRLHDCRSQTSVGSVSEEF